MQLIHLLQMLLPFYLLAGISGTAGAVQHYGHHAAAVRMVSRRSTVLPLRRETTAQATMNNYLQTDIEVGNQSLPVIIDTGSSFLWLATSTTECLDTNGIQIEAGSSACPFEQLYKEDGTLSAQASPLWLESNLGNASSNVSMWGTLAAGPVSLGGISVPSLSVVLLNQTYPPLIGAGAGALGLGPPAPVCVYNGSSTSTCQAPPSQPMVYINQFHRMMESYSVAPSFSIALSRDQSDIGFGGFLSFGAPPALTDPRINITYSTCLSIGLNTNTWQTDAIGFTVNPGSGNQTFTSNASYTLDTTSQYNILSSSDILKVYSAYDPSPVWSTATGGPWTVPCDVTVQPVAVMMGGGTISINPEDMLLQFGSTCAPAFQPSDSEPLILGRPFLVNVLATWNIGPTTMGLSVQARPYYQS